MAIIVNGTSIPDDGDYIVVNGVKVTKVVANGVTVWERKTKPKSAPPFLSAGWKTIMTNRWTPVGLDSEEHLIYHLYDPVDAGTQWISENEISAFFVIAGNDGGPNSSLDRAYIFYLPTPIETNKYSSIYATTEDDYDNDTSEGAGSINVFVCSRFSNDGTNWTRWVSRSTPDQSYKYAQVGYFFGAESESSTDLWYWFRMTNFTIT